MASSESVMGLFQQQTLRHPKPAQLNKELYKCYITMHSKGKPMTGPVIIQTHDWACDNSNPWLGLW